MTFVLKGGTSINMFYIKDKSDICIFLFYIEQFFF